LRAFLEVAWLHIWKKMATHTQRRHSSNRHKQNGIEIQTYSAIIACMLIALWTGCKPTKRTFEMICFYFCGLASEEELTAHIDKLKKQTS